MSRLHLWRLGSKSFHVADHPRASEMYSIAKTIQAKMKI